MKKVDSIGFTFFGYNVFLRKLFYQLSELPGQNIFRDEHSFIVGDHCRRGVSCHGVFYYFGIFSFAKQNTNTWIFMRSFYIAIQCFEIKV